MNSVQASQDNLYLDKDPKFKKIPVLLSLLIGGFFAMLNETLLNVSLNTLMKHFSISLPTVQWMSTGFMLTMSIVIPISSLLIRWFTTRTLFLGTMFTFTIGSLLCAIAPVFPILILGRLIQAIGTGLLIPLILNVFLLIYPPHKRGKIMGTLGLVMMFAPAIGPTLSGIIVEYLGWRYLFIIIIPFSTVSILFAYKYLVNITEVTKPKVDLISIVFSTIGLGSLIYGFSISGESGNNFSDTKPLLFIIVGVISLAYFSVRQFKLKDPIIDLRVFKYPMFAHATLMFLIIMMIMFASEVILPIYMQGPLSLTAATVGLVLLPGSLTEGLMSPLTGYIYDKLGPKILMIPATFILSFSMLLMSNFGSNTPVWLVILSYILLMLAVSAIIMPSETNGLNQLPKELYSHGTAVMTTLQPMCGAIGVSIFVTIMNTKQASILKEGGETVNSEFINNALLSGFNLVYFICFIISLIAIILSFIIYKSDRKDN